MPFHRTIMVGAGLCVAGLAGWAGRATAVKDKAPADEAALTAALGSADLDTRRQAAEALIHRCAGASDATLGRLVEALQDDDLIVRGSASAALAVTGPRVVDRVSPVLHDDNVRARRAAVAILSRIEPPPVAAASALSAAIRDNDPYVRRGAGEALGRLGKPGLAALRNAFRDPRRDVRRDAIGAIAGAVTSSSTIVNELGQLLSDTDDETGETAAAALTGLGPAGLEALASGLKSESSLARERAAAILGRIGPTARSVLPGLLDRTGDGASSVRRGVASALSRVGGGPAAIAALQRLLADPAADVRLAAAEGLSRVGRPATSAATDLLHAQGDPDPRVRSAATRALLSLIEANDPGSDARETTRCD